MATVAAGHGKIEDALTIHVNSAGVPVSIAYEVRDDATCMGKQQMGYFQGIIPFETNVTIVAPSPSVKFVALSLLPFWFFFFHTHLWDKNQILSLSHTPSQSSFGEAVPEAAEARRATPRTRKTCRRGRNHRHAQEAREFTSHTAFPQQVHRPIFTMPHVFAFFAAHHSDPCRHNNTQWWAVALVLVFMVAKNMF